jgi:hypothetical protein
MTVLLNYLFLEFRVVINFIVDHSQVKLDGVGEAFTELGYLGNFLINELLVGK